MYQLIVLLSTNILFLFGRYVDARQWARLRLHNPPKMIKELYGEEKVKKSYHYSLDKLLLSIVSSIQGQVTDNIFILFNLYSWLWNISNSASIFFNGSEGIASLIFTFLLGTSMLLLGIPASVYSTFFIEKKYGFNNQDSITFTQDIVKSWLISMVLGLPFVFGLLKVISVCGPYFDPIAWIFTFVIQMCLILIMPTVIQPLFNKFEVLQEGELKKNIEQLAKRLSFPLKEIYVMDGSKRSSHSNAYFFGLFGSKRIVLYDTLIKQATHDEICAILGHELGHWACNHLWKRLLFVQVQTIAIFVTLHYLIRNSSFFESFGFYQSQPIIIGLVLVQCLLSPMFVLLEYASNFLSRSHEYEADEFAVKLGLGKHLKDGLIKIHAENLSNPDPDYLYSLAHYSHPTLNQRIDEIDKKMQ